MIQIGFTFLFTLFAERPLIADVIFLFNPSRQLNDTGGVCPNDRENLVELLKELRTAMGEDFIISLSLGIDAAVL